MNQTIQQRIEELTIPVTESGCLLWIGPVVKKGYGRIRVNGKNMGAHRLMWTLKNGEIPQGMFVCHKCDVPSCVNTDHLFIGTHQDNMADRDRKGRTPMGSDHSCAKLSWEEVEQIKKSKLPTGQLAKTYNVYRGTINDIRGHRTYVRKGEARGGVDRKLTIAQRLEKFSIPVTESGCLLWTGSLILKYGRFSVGSTTKKNKKALFAHRVMWMHTYGPIPHDMYVHHRCKVKTCINPNHLYLQKNTPPEEERG